MAVIYLFKEYFLINKCHGLHHHHYLYLEVCHYYMMCYMSIEVK